MVALDRVSMDIDEGELVSLLGASGCGKTTLLRILAGLVKHDEGSVVVQGTTVREPRRDLCMVFQNFGLLPWRTVIANVAFPLELDRMGRAEREEVAARYIETVGLKGFERHYPHELSGGMQQRVGIARALTRKPLVLLMDEPFAALDAQTRESLQEDFLRIWKDLRTTVIFVTHSIDEALVMSDRVMIFTPRPGRLRRTIESPFGPDRVDRDVRALPDFARCRQEIRQMLREEPQ
ncbi:MAG: ATP-binding cassette domain-containing protein [Rhodospirillales bacterium]|nr:ATP-binding cassette domain-containing protein [Rhodospirillales bacterium]